LSLAAVCAAIATPSDRHPFIATPLKPPRKGQAMNQVDQHERRMLEWWDLRPSGAAICPRVVAGKRCLAFNGGGRCICQWSHLSGLIDHARIWLDRDGRHVYTVEPYGVDPGALTLLCHELEFLGLTARVSDRSPWFPGSTTLILVQKEEAA
jgi:hypothetical protein